MRFPIISHPGLDHFMSEQQQQQPKPKRRRGRRRSRGGRGRRRGGQNQHRQPKFTPPSDEDTAALLEGCHSIEDLLDATQSPNVRLGAARTVAEMGIHQHDADTIMRKLDEIEAAQRQR